MIALVAIVVPCVTDSTGPVPARSTSRIAAAIASWGALGDDGTLATTIRRAVDQHAVRERASGVDTDPHR